MLQSRFNLDADRAAMLAAFTEGRIGQAMQMAQNPAFEEEINRVMDFAEQLPKAPRIRALKLAEQMRKLATQTKALVGEEPKSTDTDDTEGGGKERAGRRQQALIFDLLVAFYRDLLILASNGTPENVVHRDRLQTLKRLASAGSPERWLRCQSALLLARRRLESNANINLVTEVLAMNLVAG